MSNTPDTPELNYDYSWEENEEESWLWIAAVTRPGLPEPYCYTEMFGANGKKAVAIIKRFERLSYAQAQEYARKLAGVKHKLSH